MVFGLWPLVFGLDFAPKAKGQRPKTKDLLSYELA
jgi:hypothetical protein